MMILTVFIALIALMAGFCLGVYGTQSFLEGDDYDWEAEIDKKLEYAKGDKDDYPF